ncbi:MAG: PAS domain-containing sensor histidine kinase [Eubacteriaceae bacterium]|nr:PAS domain-containing sensor histidine kinase [Eubacteriaceae bacterium]
MSYAYSILSSVSMTSILGILFIFLSRQSGKVYMRLWGLCWLVYAGVFAVDFFNIRSGEMWAQYLSARQALLLIGAWLFLMGTCRFFQVKSSRVANIIFAVSLAATFISIPVHCVYSFTLVPNILITASMLIWSGCMFISYSWTQNLPEKMAASFLIILWAFFINHFGFTIAHAKLALATYYVAVIIVIVLMLLLLIIHFKKSHFLDNRQAARFRLLVENSSECMFLYNYRKQAFEYVSSDINKVLGVSAEQLYERPERFFDHLEMPKKNQCVFSIFSKQVREPGNAILSLIRRGQIVMWMEMHYIPIQDDMGNVSSVEGIIRDVTKNKIAEEKLRETEKAKEDFVENITHEIRTPVTLIRGYAESLLDDVVPAESSKTYLNMILSKSLMLNSLLDDLKQVTHFTSQNLEYKFYETPALEFFNNMAEQCKYHVEQSFHQYSSSIDLPDDIMIIMDPQRINQVVSNLINNAVRHTAAGGEIRITCVIEPTADDVPLPDNFDNSLPAGMVAFRVIDSGSGISPAELPHLFERGFRGNRKTNTSKKESLGLGLYISQQIVGQHSGQISAMNDAGGGACFTVYLPYYND